MKGVIFDKSEVRPPVIYWGGKTKMLRWIAPNIPAHRSYIEPFCGGASVFFYKQPCALSILNDKHFAVYTFFKVLSNERLRKELFVMLDETLYAVSAMREGNKILNSPGGYTSVEIAWAFFFCTNNSFANMLYSKTMDVNIGGSGCFPMAFLRKVEVLYSEMVLKRLSNLHVYNRDALEVIKLGNKSSFIYCDPPYIGTSMEHYGGYSEEDYIALLDLLASLDSKVLISSFENEILRSFIKANKWSVQRFASGDKLKVGSVEVLVGNYPIV